MQSRVLLDFFCRRSITCFFLGGRFGYFLFFLLWGGEGGVRDGRRGAGFGFLLEIPGGGEGLQERGGGGAEGLGGCLCGIGGGGLKKYFFGGPKCPPSFFFRNIICPPYPTYQLWAFSSANESHPPPKNIPFGIPRMNFPEFPGSAFLLAFIYSLKGNTECPGVFQHFPGEGFSGFPNRIFGER